MRQDIAFAPGEVVSQQVVGAFLAGLVDAVITVDPHLHRVATLQEAMAVPQAIVLSGAEPLADLIAQRRPGALLVGPDGESAQWIAQAAARHGADYGVCLAPCRVLTVYDPIKLLQNMVMDASAALTGQVSIAVCEGGGHARIFVRGSRSGLRDQVESALEACGARHLAPASVA